MTAQNEESQESSLLSALEHVAGTDIGRRREENQDSYGILQNSEFQIFIVADGMGGVQGGAIASKKAIEVFSNKIQESESIDTGSVSEAIKQANTEVFQKGLQELHLQGMGTTFTGLAFTEKATLVFNVGDSRVYRFRSSRLQQLTQDHTLVMDLIRSGAIAPEQAENHPVSHMLTKSLGPTDSIEPDCWEMTDGPASGDRYLMCSDGLYNMVSAGEISRILQENDLASAQAECIRLANERGGTDNITVVIVAVGEGYPVSADSFPEDETQTLELDMKARRIIQEHQEKSQNGDSELKREELESPEIRERVSLEQINIPEFEEIEEQRAAAAEAERRRLENERQVTRRRLRNALFISVIVTLLFVSAMLLTNRPAKEPSPKHTRVSNKQTSVPREVQTIEPAPQKLERKSSVDPEQESSSVIQGQDANLQESNRSVAGEPAQSEGLESAESPGKVEQLLKRKDYLELKLTELKRKIASFKKPFSGSFGQVLSETTRRREELRSSLEDIREQIEEASSSLSVWYARKKRVETSNAMKLAEEISNSSETVEKSKADFERVTWNYLRESEKLRFNPDDTEQTQVVDQLISERREAMQALLDSVRNEVEHQIAALELQVKKLGSEREELEVEIDDVIKELEYMKILMSGDQEARVQKQQELEGELKISEKELSDIREILIQSAEMP